MRASEIIKNQQEELDRVWARLKSHSDLISALQERIEEIEDPDIDLDGGGRDPSVTPDVARDQPGGQPATVQAEPETTNIIGGSDDEQKQAYKDYVARKHTEELRKRGMVKDGYTWVIAPPTDEQRLIRRALAREIGWNNWDLDPKGNGGTPLPLVDAAHYYEIGGPVWLYNYDREFVMQQTMATRQRMVEDAAITDPDLAQELGADILKYMESNDPSVASDAAEADWAANG